MSPAVGDVGTASQPRPDSGCRFRAPRVSRAPPRLIRGWPAGAPVAALASRLVRNREDPSCHLDNLAIPEIYQLR